MRVIASQGRRARRLFSRAGHGNHATRSGSAGDAVSVSTSRLHNTAGKYMGKDDPVKLVRVQKAFPATGEVLAP
jgi:fructose 1,6-bisphosphatase